MDAAEQQVVDAAVAGLLDHHPPATTPATDFLRAQFDAGLAYVWFPEGEGGLGLPMDGQRRVDQLLAAAGAPPSGRVTNPIAAGQGAASIQAFGSNELKRRYLRALFTGEMRGCQLYSEPGAGSDLASLATRAERRGDEWVVNGQKVWTSGGEDADMAILLARTDPDMPKHSGLTQFVMDMHAPGVEVRPLRQMTGSAEFNEVFLTDVSVPDANRLGDVNHGWAVSQHTLVFERYNMPEMPARGEGAIAVAVAAWKRRSDQTSAAARAIRANLMEHWVRAEVLRLLQIRAGVLRAQGTSGPEGSLGKLAASTFGRHLSEWAPILLGPAGAVLADGYGPVSRRGDLAMACVYSPATAIAGGTDQIQRNIIGERVLGLPREPAVDKGIPWSRTQRNG